MKELQKIIMQEIEKHVKTENPNKNTEYLNVLNNLLSTINQWLMDTNQYN